MKSQSKYFKNRELISKPAEVRSKGYVALSGGSSLEQAAILEKIVQSNLHTNLIEQLSPVRKKAFNQVFQSYQRRVGGLSAEPDDYLLSGHELREFSLLEIPEIPRYLSYRYMYSMFSLRKIVTDFPPCIQIEASAMCNYRCIMCYQIDQEFSNKNSGFMGHMKFEMFKELIDELSGNVEAITFASRGEPLLNPNIFKMLHYTNRKFLATKLNTNASLLTEEASHQILSSGVRIVVFSVDASEKFAYDRIRVNGDYDKVRRNIERFNEIRIKHYRNNPLVVKVSGVKLGDHQNIEHLKTGWSGLVDEVAYVQYNPWEVAYEQPLNNVSEVCSELYRRMFVWWDGRYNPCDFDYRSELTKDTSPCFPRIRVDEFWNSSFYNKLRADHELRHRANRFPCNRCRAV